MAHLGVAIRALNTIVIFTYLEFRLFPCVDGNIQMYIYREHKLKLTGFFFLYTDRKDTYTQNKRKTGPFVEILCSKSHVVA